MLISGIVPPNAKSVVGFFQCGSSATSTVSIATSGDANGTGSYSASFGTSGSQNYTVPFPRAMLSNPQNLYYKATSTAGTPTFAIVISAYDF